MQQVCYTPRTHEGSPFLVYFEYYCHEFSFSWVFVPSVVLSLCSPVLPVLIIMLDQCQTLLVVFLYVTNLLNNFVNLSDPKVGL